MCWLIDDVKRDLDCQGEKFIHATWLGKSSRISIVLLEWRVGSIEWVAGSGVQVAEVSSHLFDVFFYLCDAVVVAYIYTAYAKHLKGSVASL